MNTLIYKSGRRRLLLAGSGLLLFGAAFPRARAMEEVSVSMAGTASGSEVWFRPRGLKIRPGQAVRWTNNDVGNVHTVTAYHPDNGKVLRVPAGTAGWNSGYLMPGESFVMVFDTPGVYDYFCIPHEQAGMVGRIVVGEDGMAGSPYDSTDNQLPLKALQALPAVSEIVAAGQID